MADALELGQGPDGLKRLFKVHEERETQMVTTVTKVRKVTAAEVAASAGTMETMFQWLLEGDVTMRLVCDAGNKNKVLYKEVLEGLRNIHRQLFSEEEDVRAGIEMEKVCCLSEQFEKTYLR